MMIDMKRRQEGLDAVYHVMRTDPAFSGRQVPPRPAWEAAAASFDVFPLVLDGAVVGAVLVGPEGIMHVAVLPAGRGHWATRAVLRDLIGTTLRVYGRAWSFVHSSNANARRFVESLGFVGAPGPGEFMTYQHAQGDQQCTTR